MTMSKRSRRRSKARDLGVPLELLDALGPVIARAALPVPRDSRPGPKAATSECCRAVAHEHRLPGEVVVVLRTHEKHCPVWSGR
jgi:hypothetical protein